MVLGRSNQLGKARLGLAIAKKHVKLAVERNRIKRVIRESFRHHRQLIEDFDLIVLAKPGTASQTNKQLVTSLESHWQRLGETKSSLN